MVPWRACAACTAVLFVSTACVQLLDLPDELTYPADATPTLEASIDAIAGDAASDGAVPSVTYAPFPATCPPSLAAGLCVQDWRAVAAADGGDGAIDEDADVDDASNLPTVWWGQRPQGCTTTEVTEDPTSPSTLDVAWKVASEEDLLAECSLEHGVAGLSVATGLRARIRLRAERLPETGALLFGAFDVSGDVFVIEAENPNYKISIGDRTIRVPLGPGWTDFEAHFVPGFTRADFYVDGKLLVAGIDTSMVDLDELDVVLGLIALEAVMRDGGEPTWVAHYDDLMLLPF